MLGGRDATAQDKRELLLDKAEAVFCRLGYADTTIADLAAAAGVTRPTVYSYFPSKDEVFRALADRVRREFLRIQETADSSSPTRTATESLTAYLAAYTRHHGMLTVIAHQALGDPEMQKLRDNIFARAERRHTRFLERLMATGHADPVIRPAELARAVTGVVARFAETAVNSPTRLSRLSNQLIVLYLHLAQLTDEPRSSEADHPGRLTRKR